ncbi:MAG: indolepyruvate ferredoxin oxidoreductase subunit beta [Halobacteriales archaeon]
MSNDLVVTGVGGQGALLAANAVGEAGTAAGMETRVGEIHGMSQRGGSVIAHVRVGEDVHGPMVPTGRGDAMIALEPMEALRYAEYLGPDAVVLVNETTEMPLPVQQGAAEYPDGDAIMDELHSLGEVVPVDAEGIAREAGDKIAANAVLLGAFSARVAFPLSAEQLLGGVETMVPDDAVEVNRRAFEAGREVIDRERPVSIP